MRTALILLSTVLGYVALENLIFATWYPAVLSPDSFAGHIDMNIRHERGRPKTGPQVLAIGNSRMGLLPRYINGVPEIGYTFANISVGATSPRDWYYMLRDVDPTHRAYAAIAIQVDSYDDPDGWQGFEWLPDVNRIAARLRWSDIPWFAGSFHSRSLRVKAALGVALKGSLYRADFQDLLTNPDRGPRRSERLARLERFEFVPDYVLSVYNVAGVQIDWKSRTAAVPRGHRANEKADFESALFPPPNAAPARNTIDWFGRICDLYRDSHTRIVFVHLPRGPYPPPPQYAPPRNDHSSVRMLGRRPGAILDDEDYYRELEEPEMFKDPKHFNLLGTARFSRMFGQHVSALLGPPAR